MQTKTRPSCLTGHIGLSQDASVYNECGRKARIVATSVTMNQCRGMMHVSYNYEATHLLRWDSRSPRLMPTLLETPTLTSSADANL